LLRAFVLAAQVKRTKYGDDIDADMDRTVTNNIMRKQGCVQPDMI